MAFASMMMVFGAILLIILGIMTLLFVAGLILLIIGIVTKVQNKDKLYPTVLITVGAIMIGIDLLVVIAVAILAVIGS